MNNWVILWKNEFRSNKNNLELIKFETQIIVLPS